MYWRFSQNETAKNEQKENNVNHKPFDNLKENNSLTRSIPLICFSHYFQFC
jgi:hypothetical protein